MQVDRQGLLNATTVKEKDTWLGNALSLSDQGMQHGIRIKQSVLMANISNYGSDVISEVPHSETYLNDMENQILEETMQMDKQGLLNATTVKVKDIWLGNALSLSDQGMQHATLILEEKDIFNVFDKDLLNEIMEVQTVFDQMNVAVQQSSVDKECLEIAKKELLLENDRLLQQIMSQVVLLAVMNSMSLKGKSVNMERKTQLQDKDTTICKLKEIIKSMREKSKEENVNHGNYEIKTKNVELENSVAKLISKNERLCKEINHVKQVFKEQFDSIKKTRVSTKEHSDSLIDKLNLKSVENEDLKAQIQYKVFVITSLKNDLQKVKGKDIVDIATQKPSANTIVPGMFKLDLDPLAPKLLQNREAHIDYLKFENDHIARIMGYGDYQLGNVTISRVYYVEGLGHNLFYVGSQDINLYTNSLDDMLKTSSICLLSKAPKTKSWLWHHRFSLLNFGTLNKLAKDSLTRGIPRLKFYKDHLCSACALGKSKKSSHQPKAKDTNQKKLYLLHMDSCGPMHAVTINGKRYILVIVDYYSRFTWVKILRSKDEAPEAIIKCIKNIQVRLNSTIYAKADIGIFVGYVPVKKAFRIYNKRTRKIIETIHVTFNELTAMASEQFSSGLGLHSMTPTTSILVVAAPRAVDLANSPVSLLIDQDAQSASIPSIQKQEHSSNISQSFVESPTTPHFRDDLLHESLHKDLTSQGSSLNVRPIYTPFKSLGRWTKDHPIANRRSFSLSFLNGELKEEFYVSQPEGFVDQDNPSHVENGIVELYFIRTEYQLADIFTKPFPKERFNFLIEKLGMRSMSPEMLNHLTEEEDE
uniref:Uncharacterized protein n=1 Tax=Tanacetum cinerariifolium TaxID=118510 RepID=A0A6L2L3C3_TANCI|nr:hypothetical protein [Tanacetum cinerariifolium]